MMGKLKIILILITVHMQRPSPTFRSEEYFVYEISEGTANLKDSVYKT